jgi:hypothetical protein
MTAWSQSGVLVGIAVVTTACGASRADQSSSDSASADAGEDQAAPHADSDGSPNVGDSSDICHVLEPVTLSRCPMDWDSASQGHCHLETEPSPGCGYLRAPLQGTDTSTLCFFDATNHKLVGARIHSAISDTTECWGVAGGFSDPVGCQFVPDNCPLTHPTRETATDPHPAAPRASRSAHRLVRRWPPRERGRLQRGPTYRAH